MADILGKRQKPKSGAIIGAPRLDESGNPIIIAPAKPAADPTISRRGNLGGGLIPRHDPLLPTEPLSAPENRDPYFTALENMAVENKSVKKQRSFGYSSNVMGGAGLLGAGGSIRRRSLLGL